MCLKLIKDQVRDQILIFPKQKVSYAKSYSHYKYHRASLVFGLHLCLIQIRSGSLPKLKHLLFGPTPTHTQSYIKIHPFVFELCLDLKLILIQNLIHN